MKVVVKLSNGNGTFLLTKIDSKISKSLKEKISDIVWEVGFESYIVISPLILTREEIENSPLRVSPIVKNIIEEGVVG